MSLYLSASFKGHRIYPDRALSAFGNPIFDQPILPISFFQGTKSLIFGLSMIFASTKGRFSTIAVPLRLSFW